MNASKTVSDDGHDQSSAADGGEPAFDGADLRRVLDSASELARESPRAALAIAVAAGFVLGGGLTPRLLGSAAMIAGRTYLGRALRETLTTVVEEQIAAARG
jgi:hypothetical protein